MSWGETWVFYYSACLAAGCTLTIAVKAAAAYFRRQEADRADS